MTRGPCDKTNCVTVKLHWPEHYCIVYHGKFELSPESLENISVVPNTHIFMMVQEGLPYIVFKMYVMQTHQNRST